MLLLKQAKYGTDRVWLGEKRGRAKDIIQNFSVERLSCNQDVLNKEVSFISSKMCCSCLELWFGGLPGPVPG